MQEWPHEYKIICFQHMGSIAFVVLWGLINGIPQRVCLLSLYIPNIFVNRNVSVEPLSKMAH